MRHLTEAKMAHTVGITVEKQRGFILKRRIRVSYQKGSIEKKGANKYLLRYRVRDLNHPGGWRKVAELISATTDKAADKERNKRMRQINSDNERYTAEKAKTNEVLTFGKFSETLWITYLRNKRVKESTLDSYGSVLRHHLLPVLANRKLDEITPAELADFFDGLATKMSTKFILNIYAQLRVMFEVAVEYDLIPVSPVRKKLVVGQFEFAAFFLYGPRGALLGAAASTIAISSSWSKTWSAIPASIAGVTRSVLWTRQKL